MNRVDAPIGSPLAGNFNGLLNKKFKGPGFFPTFARVLVCIAPMLAIQVASATETVTYYYSDNQGTVLATTNASGALTATIDYRPYGTQTLGSPSDSPGYTGHVNDVDSSLVYMQARYYDPNVGRFLSIDPVSVSQTNLFGFNRYAYADNSPVLEIDPDGMQSCTTSDAQTQDPCPTAPAPEPKKAPVKDPPNTTTLAGLVVTAARSGGMGLGGEVLPRWLARLSAVNPYVLGVALYAVDSNTVSNYLYGQRTCYGEITCDAAPNLLALNKYPPGFWDAEAGASEWGRRNGIGGRAGKDKFHDVKQGDTVNKGGKRDWSVNPDTGDVADPAGDVIGNLGDTP